MLTRPTDLLMLENYALLPVLSLLQATMLLQHPTRCSRSQPARQQPSAASTSFSSSLRIRQQQQQWQQQQWDCRSSRFVCCALERYMIDKLSAAERTFKELQLRMSDPEVAANATEFQKVRLGTF